MTERAETLAAIGQAIDDIARAGREPDDWEATHIGAAVSMASIGWNNAAAGYVWKAVQPADKRVAPTTRDDKTPTLAALRQALELICG